MLVELDRDAGPLGAQIQHQLRAAVRSRRLGAGERLPSTRRLAELLGVSRGTVVDVYEQLLAEGYLESVVGSGTRVAPMSSEAVGDGATLPDDGVAPPGHEDVDPSSRVNDPPRVNDASRTNDASRVIDPPRVIDFEYGIPDLRTVPLADWSWAISTATRTLPTAELGDDDLAGSSHLREVVSAYHRRVRSGCATAEDTVVVSGFRQGLTFALAALARHGVRRIALEDPGPREHRLIAERAGLEAVPVPVDDDGLDVARLRESGARAVLSTPAHQCPTGVALGPARRRELIAWAEEVDGVILEDDYDAEFRYDRQPVGSLQGLAADRVIALGSVSKTLAPAIRLGWVLAPRRFLGGIIGEKRLGSRGAPGLDQEALAVLMETGRFDRHLRRMREIYRNRRDVLAAESEQAFGPGRLNGLAAGCHALLRLPPGSSESVIVASAATRGVRVRALGDYRFDDDPAPERPALPPALVLGFGNVGEEEIRRGIRALAEAVAVTVAGRGSGPEIVS